MEKCGACTTPRREGNAGFSGVLRSWVGKRVNLGAAWRDILCHPQHSTDVSKERKPMPNTSASRSWAVWYDENQNRTWRSSTNGQWDANGATHRYVLCRDGLRLHRSVQPRDGCVNFIMLNPSVSGRRNSGDNDRTVGNCEELARYWGYRKLIVTNLFALISPEPENLLNCQDPVGPCNDHYLVRTATRASLRVAAWGEKYGAYRSQDVWFRNACAQEGQEGLELTILDFTKKYQPMHPRPLSKQSIRQFHISSLQCYPYPYPR